MLPMKKPWRKRFRRNMIRPTVYKAFTRLILALTASLAWNEFVNHGLAERRSWPFVFFAIFFAAAAWMSYLRLDGIRAPQFDRRIFDWKRKPPRMYGDMIDYVDEDVPDFDDLEEDEQHLCLLIANAVCCVIFAVISLF